MSTSRSCTFLDHKKTADLVGAHLSFVRHPRGYRTRNAFTMSRLLLCPEKAQISALVRHPSAEKSTTRPSHIPQPTTHRMTHPTATCAIRARSSRPTPSQQPTYPCFPTNAKFPP